MPLTTRYVGLVLMILGLASYWLTGRTSLTALIPSFIGILFTVLALLAQRESLRRHMMHAAVALALIGALGVLARAVPAVIAGDAMRPAVLSQLATAAVLLFYVRAGVQSFIAARRDRKI
jgi:hypothetical protein